MTITFINFLKVKQKRFQKNVVDDASAIVPLDSRWRILRRSCHSLDRYRNKAHAIIEEDPEDDKLAWRIRPTVSVENKHILFVFGDLKNTHEKEFVSNWSLKHGAIKILNASLVIRAGDGLSSDRRYSCFSIGQESLVGCGLSLDGHGSNLPDLYSLDLG